MCARVCELRACVLRVACACVCVRVCERECVCVSAREFLLHGCVFGVGRVCVCGWMLAARVAMVLYYKVWYAS